MWNGWAESVKGLEDTDEKEVAKRFLSTVTEKFMFSQCNT
jgi:hypothetical protein